MFPFAQQTVLRQIVLRGAAITIAATFLLAPTTPALAQAPTASQSPAASGALPAPPAWDKLKAAYDYRPAAADPDYLIERVSLLDGEGKSIPGLFLRPKPKGVYPVVLLLHGLTMNKDQMMNWFGRPLAAKGFACLALDARDHGERKPSGPMWDVGSLLAPDAARKPNQASPQVPAPGGPVSEAGVRFGLVLRGTVGDYRRALDYLQTREDVDSQRVGLLGYSMGAMMGAILAGVDERIKATVLEVGGDPIRPLVSGVPGPLREQTEAISPSNYIGHIAPRPVLLINAKEDQIMKVDAAKRLQEAAREPKQIVWAEGGHILAETDSMRGVAWLEEKLNPKQ